MSYIGSTPTTQSFIAGTDYFSGTGSQTAFTLSRSVVSVNDIQATVNNVVQVPNDAYTVSGTTITFTSAPSAGTNNVYVRYLSTTTQSITPSQGTVGWNTLDSNIQQDLGVMYKNRVINGNMVINQRGFSGTVTTDAVYTLDRWKARSSPGSRYSISQNAGSVTPPTGFVNYLGATSLSAYSPISADFFSINQLFEGNNVSDLAWGTANAKTVTLSFWVYSSLTGTFGGSFTSGVDFNYSYPFTYTISAANTWQYKTVTVVGPTAGNWSTTNGSSIEMWFTIGLGTTYAGTANTWQSGGKIGPSGCVNVVATNGATFYLTGVQLEVGTQATTFTTAGGSYGAELALCQRYFRTVGRGGAATPMSVQGAQYLDSNTIYLSYLADLTSMRALPTASLNGTANTDYAIYNSGFSPQTGFTFTLGVYQGFTGYQIQTTKTSHGLSNLPSLYFGSVTSSGFVSLSSEL